MSGEILRRERQQGYSAGQAHARKDAADLFEHALDEVADALPTVAAGRLMQAVAEIRGHAPGAKNAELCEQTLDEENRRRGIGAVDLGDRIVAVLEAQRPGVRP